jgi:dethiobiotin synthetase
MSKKLFITGTGTDVGKTYVTGLILKKLRESGKSAAYYKAAMSGNVRDADGRLIPGDALQVKTISGIEQPLESMCPYVYEAAVSPHLAARMEGNPVQLSFVWQTFQQVCRQYDYVTMEGSGGILCPLRFDKEELLLDGLVKELNLSSLIVADAGLGTINSVVLTAEYMRAKELVVKGIVLNKFHPGDPMEEDNRFMCEAMTGLKVLACVRHGDTELAMDADALALLYE